MQFRFRKYNEDKDTYELIGIANIEDYDTMFKTLTFMKEHKCEYPIELNTENIVETTGFTYYVTQVSLCINNEYGEEALLPHFVVDVEEEY